jgi:hypothetical protein
MTLNLAVFKCLRFTKQQSFAQGLVEFALVIPVLLVLVSGLIEFGFALIEYMSVQDAVRNAARFASDSAYQTRDSSYNCVATRDFYRQTACLLNIELRTDRPLIKMHDNYTTSNFNDDLLDPTRGDEMVISVFSMLEGYGVTRRFPTEYGELGWSYALDVRAGGMITFTEVVTPTRNEISRFTSTDITNRWKALDQAAGRTTPSTGILLVELHYHYDQKLKAPWITSFVPDPLPIYFYAVMPLVSAEPTPTPRP